jgi:hypothetical protein
MHGQTSLWERRRWSTKPKGKSLGVESCEKKGEVVRRVWIGVGLGSTLEERVGVGFKWTILLV